MSSHDLLVLLQRTYRNGSDCTFVYKALQRTPAATVFQRLHEEISGHSRTTAFLFLTYTEA
jgi:hypothetical protein